MHLKDDNQWSPAPAVETHWECKTMCNNFHLGTRTGCGNIRGGRTQFD